MMNTGVLILAAGEGKRMKSKTAKVLNKVCFKPMIDYIIRAAKAVTDEKPVVIAGHKKEDIEAYLKDSVSYAYQYEQKGTGHAVMMAERFLEKDEIVVLNGDMPLISPETLKKAVDFHRNGDFSVTVVGAEFENPAGYGRLVIKDNVLEKIVEHKDANEEELKIKYINAGIYIFKGEDLGYALGKINNNNAQGEYYLTDTVEIIKNDMKKAGAYIVEDKNEIMGCNTRAELAQADAYMRERINRKLMENGVTIIDPKCTYIEDTVEIGRDTVIYPGAVITGNTKIGEDCEVLSSSNIYESEIGNGVSIKTSTVLESVIGDNTTVGPYAYIRPLSKIGKNCRIGDFVEIKKSTIDDGTKVSHLTYVGDSTVGKNVNFGCGTVTVNYDGINKFKTTIGDNCFIGCNANLVAPVTVEDNSFIAAGSTITDTVPENGFAIARARQVNKENWVKPKDR